MRPTHWTDLFALLFDPRVPVTFLIGSVVLSILGNAAYVLLVSFTGESRSVLVAIVFITLLIFLFLTITSWIWLRTRRPGVVEIPPEQQASPCAGLVLLISPPKGTSEEHAISYHLDRQTLRHCWLLASAHARPKAEALALDLSTNGVQSYIVDLSSETQARVVYDAVKQALQQAREVLTLPSVIVDITGGTKPMTAGAALACLVDGAQMEYMLPIRTPDGHVDGKARPVPMRVDLRHV